MTNNTMPVVEFGRSRRVAEYESECEIRIDGVRVGRLHLIDDPFEVDYPEWTARIDDPSDPHNLDWAYGETLASAKDEIRERVAESVGA